MWLKICHMAFHWTQAFITVNCPGATHLVANHFQSFGLLERMQLVNQCGIVLKRLKSFEYFVAKT